LAWWPATHTTLGVIGILLGPSLAALIATGFLSLHRHKHWFRNHLIPQAEQQGVDLPFLAAALASVDRTDKSIAEKVRDMVAAASLLEEVLIETGKLEPRGLAAGA
jgi:hypothetical protein